MDQLLRLIDAILNMISVVFFAAALIVFGGILIDHAAASKNYMLIDSPSMYNVHTVTQNQFTTCMYIETESGFRPASSVYKPECNISESTLKQWKDNGQNYHKLDFKFWLGTGVFFLIGSLVMAWMPLRIMGSINKVAGGIAAAICVVFVGIMTTYMTVHEIRTAYAPPQTWRTTVGENHYSADVKFFLQDKNGNVYNWSSGGTADSYSQSNLGKPTENPIR